MKYLKCYMIVRKNLSLYFFLNIKHFTNYALS